MVDCRQNSTRYNSPTNSRPFTCFSCGEIGHKSPVCPKNKRTRPDRGETKSPLVKHRDSSQVNRITLTDRTPIAPAEIDGKKSLVLLDTGAEIGVVPKGYVLEPQYLRETVTIQGYDKHPSTVELAEITIKMEGVLP